MFPRFSLFYTILVIFPIQLCMVQWSFISLLYFMFLYAMLKLNIMSHLLWKIDVFFYFHHYTSQVFFFSQSRWGFQSFLEMSWAVKGVISLKYLSVFHCQNIQTEKKLFKIAEKNGYIWEFLIWLVNIVTNFFKQIGFVNYGLHLKKFAGDIS